MYLTRQIASCEALKLLFPKTTRFAMLRSLSRASCSAEGRPVVPSSISTDERELRCTAPAAPPAPAASRPSRNVESLRRRASVAPGSDSQRDSRSVAKSWKSPPNPPPPFRSPGSVVCCGLSAGRLPAGCLLAFRPASFVLGCSNGFKENTEHTDPTSAAAL